MDRYLFVSLLLFLGLPGISLGQGAPPDPLRQAMYPIELVMDHQLDLKLTDAQREAITKQMSQSQPIFQATDWDLKREMESLAALLKEGQVDEKKAIETAEKVMSLENKMKREQLLVLVRVKNILTPEQKARLDTIKTEAMKNRPPGAGPIPPGEGPMKPGANGPAEGPGAPGRP